MKRLICGIVFMFLLISVFALTFEIPHVRADARIWTVDDDGPADFHTIQDAVNNANEGDTIYVKPGVYMSIDLSNKHGLALIGENEDTTTIEGTIYGAYAKNVTISHFTIHCGLETWLEIVWFKASSNITVSSCNIINNNTSGGGYAIFLRDCEGCTIYRNKVESKGYANAGIDVMGGSSNLLIGNFVQNYVNFGIQLTAGSSKNTIAGNEIRDNGLYAGCGIYIDYGATGNTILHNNLLNNRDSAQSGGVNVWDDGYPSGGNYWSDYNGVDANHDGIGDTPYVINSNNIDHYPLMKPWSPALQPDFDVSISPETQIGQPSPSVYYQVRITSKNGFSSGIALDASFSPYPGHIGWDLYPNPVTPPSDGQVTSTFTVNIYSDTPLKTFTITVTATSGAITKTATCGLEVERSLEVPYQNQGYAEWCAPNSLAMVLNYYGFTLHGWDIAEWEHLSTSQGIKIEDLKPYIDENYPTLTCKVGYYYNPLDKESILEDVRSNLTAGFPVIIQLGELPNILKGHAVVAVGFNETGLFVNDPSGALFTDEGFLHLASTDPKYPQSWIHTYLEWSDIAKFIRTWPLASTLAVQGTPKPDEHLGSVHVISTLAILFYQPGDPQNGMMTQDYYCLYLDNGLKWVHNYTKGQQWTLEQDNIVASRCSRLYVSVNVSNNAPYTQSFAFRADFLGPNGLVQPITSIPRPINDLRGFSEDQDERASGGLMDVSTVLTKGVPYSIKIYLIDSRGNTVDQFTSETFYWAKGTKVKLSENTQHLYLHVYDSLGNHVGFNYKTNQVDLNIPGSYYSDDGNGTIIIVVPQTMNLTIVVDARFAEDPIESYNLTVITETDLGSSVQTYSGTIAQGMADTHHLYVPSNETPIIDDAPPSTQLTIGEPKRVTSTQTYVTRDSLFALTADDGAGSGVAETAYRISNSKYDSGWTHYVAPFNLTSLSDGNYTLAFNSTDNAGNVEASKIVTIVIDNTPPSTSLAIGDPKYATATSTFVTPDTPFTLAATETGSGIKSTAYRITSSTGYDSGWLTYTKLFNLTSLRDGNYTIAFNSTDNVGNVEATNTVNVTLAHAIAFLSGNNHITLTGSDNVVIITGGNDIIDATQATATTVIKTGAGHEIINLGGGNNMVTETAGGSDIITAGNGNNTITITGNGNYQITTGSGNDQIQITGDGNSIINAGDGNNIVRVSGKGNNQITTGSGNDMVVAGNGNNIIKTGAGDDNITVGFGNNNIDGGAGYDVCIHGTGHNTILNCEIT